MIMRRTPRREAVLDGSMFGLTTTADIEYRIADDSDVACHGHDAAAKFKASYRSIRYISDSATAR